MAADQVKPEQESTEAKSPDASDSDVSSGASEQEATTAALQKEVQDTTTASDSNTTTAGSDSNDNGTTTTDAIETGDQAENTAEAEDPVAKMQKDGLAKTLSEANLANLTPAQRAELIAKGVIPKVGFTEGADSVVGENGREIELDGSYSLGKSESRTSTDAVIKHDGKEIIRFDDADVMEWEGTKIDVNLPDSTVQLDSNESGTFSTLAGSDGSTTQIIQSKDGSIHIRNGNEYISMTPGFYGEVTEGADARKAFEAEAEKFDIGANVQQNSGSNNSSASVSLADGTELLNIQDGSVNLNSIPESAQVLSNGESSLIKFSDGTEMIKSNGGDTMIRSADGNIINVSNSGEITECNETHNGNWDEQAAKFETTVEATGNDGGTEDSSSWLSWDGFVNGVEATGDFLGFDGSFGYDASWADFDTTDIDYSGDDLVLGDLDLFNGDASSDIMDGLESFEKYKTIYEYEGIEGLRSLKGKTYNEIGQEVKNKYNHNPLEGIPESSLKVNEDGERAGIKVGPNGEMRFVNSEGNTVEIFADGTEKVTIKDSGTQVFREKSGRVTRVEADGSTRITYDDRPGERQDALATGRPGDTLDVDTLAELKKEEIEYGKLTRVKGMKGFFTRTPGNGDLVHLTEGENGQVTAEIIKEDGTRFRGSLSDIHAGRNDRLQIKKPGEEYRDSTSEERGEAGFELYGPIDPNGNHPNILGLHRNEKGEIVLQDGTKVGCKTDGQGLEASRGTAKADSNDDGTGALTTARRTEAVDENGNSVTTNSSGDVIERFNSTTNTVVGVDPNNPDRPSFVLGKNNTYLGGSADMSVDDEGNLYNGFGTDPDDQFYNASTGTFDSGAYNNYSGWAEGGYDGGYAGFNSPEAIAAREEAKATAQGASGKASLVNANVKGFAGTGDLGSILSAQGGVADALSCASGALGQAMASGDSHAISVARSALSEALSANSLCQQAISIAKRFETIAGPLSGDSVTMSYAIKKGTATSISSEDQLIADLKFAMGDTNNAAVKKVYGDRTREDSESKMLT